MSANPQLAAKNFYWQPNVKTIMLVVVCTPFLMALGMWQLSRAEEKRVIESRFQYNQQASPMQAADLYEKGDWQYRPAWLRGTLDPAKRVFLDNRVRHNRAGYEILEVLTLPNDDHRVLVNRGWFPAPLDRNKLPTPPSVHETIQLRGFLYRNLPGGYVLDDGITKPEQWPVRLGWISVERASELFNMPFHTYQLRLDRDSAAALETGWPTVAVQPHKHTAYAVQWFTMAFVLLVMGVFASSNLGSCIKSFFRRRPHD